MGRGEDPGIFISKYVSLNITYIKHCPGEIKIRKIGCLFDGDHVITGEISLFDNIVNAFMGMSKMYRSLM